LQLKKTIDNFNIHKYEQKRLHEKVVTYREGKFYHRTGYKGPEEEERENPTLSLTSKLAGAVGQCHASAHLLPGKRTGTH